MRDKQKSDHRFDDLPLIKEGICCNPLTVWGKKARNGLNRAGCVNTSRNRILIAPAGSGERPAPDEGSEKAKPLKGL
jgi:hypothetical protein